MGEPKICSQCGRVHHPASPCPQAVEKRQERIILTKESLREHLEAQGNVAWVELGELLADRSEACVDGRGEQGIVGVPGGNAGEFVLALSTYEDMTGEELTEDQIQKIFISYLEKYGKFYFHTDKHALEHAGLTPEQLENPMPEQRNSLLNILTKADNIGCGHLKLAMKNEDTYSMRPELVASMLKAFFNELWSGNDNVEFVILSGDHTEGAVITVMVDTDQITEQTKVPTITPSVDAYGTKAFVCHPQAVKFLRDQIAESINEVIGLHTGTAVSTAAFAEQMSQKGDTQLNETVTRLAKDDKGMPLPQFKVIYASSGELRAIEQA